MILQTHYSGNLPTACRTINGGTLCAILVSEITVADTAYKGSTPRQYSTHSFLSVFGSSVHSDNYNLPLLTLFHCT